MLKKVYQLKMSLLDYKPSIWRRILVNPDTSLDDLHKIIQTAMGWEGYHLYEFSGIAKKYESDEFDEGKPINSKKATNLNQTFLNENQSIIYTYDFGDTWEHEIIFEQIIDVDTRKQIPCCIGGKLNCPPEDCGGTYGYANLLHILSHPRHREYRETREWLVSKFDPLHFSMAAKNKLLKQKDFGYGIVE